MDSVATHSLARSPRASWRHLDAGALSTWVLAGALVLYLGLEGGGYDNVVRGQAGTVVWWAVLVGAAWGVLPRGRLTRAKRFSHETCVKHVSDGYPGVN